MAYSSQNKISPTEGNLALDENGIPVLADVIMPAFDTDQSAVATPAAATEESLPESVVRLLEQEHVRQMIEDLSNDLQVEISWKIEESLKQSMNRLLHDAMEANSRQILESIQTQLRLTLPELLLSTLSQKT